MATTPDISNPILNSPYSAPEHHFEIGPNGPTGTILDGRRPSESFVPIPAARKGKSSDQQALDFDTTGERREVNTLINDIRFQVAVASAGLPWCDSVHAQAPRALVGTTARPRGAGAVLPA